ncbi:hypothetical protein MOQ95_004748, partial [Salmonella enterica]|nr:hypothetical protein [Salmonella enterica]
MAVENKFKLNFITASVLMGLSLSAVASAEPTTNKETETKPAVTKTLAEAVKAVNPTEVTFDKGEEKDNPSEKQDLVGLLGYISPLNFSDAINRSNVTKSVGYAHGKLLDAYNTAKGTPNAATELQKLVAFNRATAEQMVKGDTAALNNTMDTQQKTIDGARDSISQEMKGLSDTDSKARAAYDKAIADFLKLPSETQSGQGEQNKLMTTLAGKNNPLVDGASFTQISAAGGGFKTYDELVKEASTNPSGNILTSHVKLIQAQQSLNSALTDVTAQRGKLAQSMTYLANSMPFYTSEEQDGTDGARAVYLDALKSISKASTSADSQSKAGDAGQVTHILGSLTSDELQQFDPLTGEYKSVIVNTDGEGNVTGVKDNFTANDLYTGTQDNPFTTTVLDIRALELGNGPLADTNTITVGEAGSKATPVEIWAKTAGKSGTAKPAVILSGNLRTATAQVDDSGQPVKGQIVRGADQIHLQNVNIHNSFTLADKAKMMADDMAAINQQANDKLAAGQSATDVGNSRTEQTTALNTKYDGYALTGLQIATKTVNPSFELTDQNTAGTFVNHDATVAPDDANILLDNLNITLQNDSTGGTSTAIALSGTSNHILANGGVFDAGSVTGTEALPAQANALAITGAN